LTTWNKFFNFRQTLELITFTDHIRKSYKSILKECLELKEYNSKFCHEELAKSIVGYLGLILSRHSSYNANLCWWEPTGERTFNVFGRQALPMVWDYTEQNPFGISTGNIESQIEITTGILNDLMKVSKKDETRRGSISITNASATSLPYVNNFFDAVLTDPPYYDNVHYADLSDFFYVWLKRAVGNLFPDIFATPLTPKAEEIIASRHRHKNSEAAKDFFEKKLTEAFKEVYRVLKPDGIAIIVYAHKTTAGWETLLNSLINSGLVVTASWPIHTEMKTRLVASETASLASSIYMVCRKIPKKQVGFLSDITVDLEESIQKDLERFWNTNIKGGDFFISAIGPAMKVFSIYKHIEKFDGTLIGIDELLSIIRSISTNFIVNKLLDLKSSSIIDKQSQFYLMYRWTYSSKSVKFDDARKIASAFGIDLDQLWGKYGFVKKKGSIISLLGPKERKIEKDSTLIVDIAHTSVLLWEKGKRNELEEILTKSGQKNNSSFWIFCQAIAESLEESNKEKKTLRRIFNE
jgi:putative DNA methylase